MKPQRSAIPRRRFPVYAALLYVGLLAALTAGDHFARRAGMDPVRTVTAMVLIIPVCLAGARGLVVALHWKRFRARPAEILRVDHGGAAMYGGLVPAILISVPLLRFLDLPFGTFWDIAAVAILAGMIPTRLGCFLNGCCAGRITSGPLGLPRRDGHGAIERRLPTPLFEASLGLALLLISFPFFSIRPFPGAVCLFAVGGYAAARFALEWLRENRDPVVAGLGAYQWISLALFIPCALGLAFGWSAEWPAVVAAADPAPSGLAHLITSGLLLLPILYVFRFLGCDIPFPLNEPPSYVLRLGATVPGLAGEVTAEVKIVVDSSMVEIAQSPVDLGVAFGLPDGRTAFGTTLQLVSGTYRATCTIRRGGVAEREAESIGELVAPDLVVLFEAPAGDATGLLSPKLEFAAALSESTVLAAAAPASQGSGPFTATMTLESQFNEGGIDDNLPSVGLVGQLEGFEATRELPLGFYRSTCTVTRQGVATRTGQCSGEHVSPGEQVAYLARDTDPQGVLNVVRCFEVP